MRERLPFPDWPAWGASFVGGMASGAITIPAGWSLASSWALAALFGVMFATACRITLNAWKERR